VARRLLERLHVRPVFADEKLAERISQTLGSFLGECVIRCHGGEWREIDGSWAVDFGGGNAAFTFNKIRKQLGNGAEDGVNSWFNSIPLIFARRDDEQPEPQKKRPWWKPGG
jgi:hypothetical protein